MKNWITHQKEGINSYLIVNNSFVWITKQPQEEDINTLINEHKLNNVSIFNLEEIKEFIFNDTDNMLTINFKKSKHNEIELTPESSVYTEIKSYFLKNLRGVDIKDYSLLKQIQPFALGLLIFSGITWLLYTTAVSLQNGEQISTGGRRGLIKKIVVGIADFLGPTGVLIIGGILIFIFLSGFISTIRKPKQGNVLKIKKNTTQTFVN